MVANLSLVVVSRLANNLPSMGEIHSILLMVVWCLYYNVDVGVDAFVVYGGVFVVYGVFFLFSCPKNKKIYILWFKKLFIFFVLSMVYSLFVIQIV